MPHLLADAHRLLTHHFGYPDFRPAQLPVVCSILQGQDTLAVLPTGGGKSICFQVPALVLGGLSVVVSPLISLMQDQVDAARARGVAAACLNSSLTKAEQNEVHASIAAGTLRLLYVSPERLDRLSGELSVARIRPRLLVIDEAHCITEWGHDFRPSYRKLARVRYRLGMPQVIALTGSATPGVRDQIIRTLRFKARHSLHLGSFDRPNLWFGAVRVESEAERLNALLQLLRGDDNMAIVYAPTRGTTEAIARSLSEAGHRAAPYHAGLTRPRRRAALENFLSDQVDVVVATCAFGMGIDKPNVRLVVHWAPPATPEAYYQEAGRAGRDGEFARCVLLWRPTDSVLHRRQLDVTFPPRRLLERIWSKPDGHVGVPNNVLDSAERLRRELHPERGPVDWRPVIRRRRDAELRIAAVEAYARETGCRRERLVGYFGEKLARCSGCDRCGKKRHAVREVGEAREVAHRISRLRQALSRSKAPWGGCPVEPEVLRRLAEHPPSNPAALADVPGVGPELAARVGGVILRALGVELGTGNSREDDASEVSLLVALQNWRAGVARCMGVPPYLVLTNATMHNIAKARPRNRLDLARVPGIGPRALAKFGDELVGLADFQTTAPEPSGAAT
jgi:RecQ family ATP-dependent DNA helicase